MCYIYTYPVVRLHAHQCVIFTLAQWSVYTPMCSIYTCPVVSLHTNLLYIYTCYTAQRRLSSKSTRRKFSPWTTTLTITSTCSNLQTPLSNCRVRSVPRTGYCTIWDVNSILRIEEIAGWDHAEVNFFFRTMPKYCFIYCITVIFNDVMY